jgi:hypothetical protein
MRKHEDDDNRFVRVSSEAEQESGLTAKVIYSEAAKGNITIYKRHGGRLNYVKERCLKALAKGLFEPRGKKRPAPPGRGKN